MSNLRDALRLQGIRVVSYCIVFKAILYKGNYTGTRPYLYQQHYKNTTKTRPQRSTKRLNLSSTNPSGTHSVSRTTKGNTMQLQSLTPEQEVEFHEVATIEQTIQTESSKVLICNIGTKKSPCRYVVINDEFGNSSINPPFFIN